MTRAFIPTVKETPADAEVISHQLMIRAGMMRKLGAGIYTYLPFGLKVIRKVEQIIREEMNRAGAQELLMPILSPAELWMESGRWNVYGKELMRIKDRHNREFALGPTHEEIITDLVRTQIKSYRELPVNLYQIQTKFRDEIRPRFGVMRAREFVMKDAYSFHTDEASLKETYDIMFETYKRIFTRCGLKFKPVLADSGAIGGDTTHEFSVLADSGESALFYCQDDSCGYAASSEFATGIIPAMEYSALSVDNPMEKINTPNLKTVDEVSDFFGVAKHYLIKTLLYVVEDKVVAVLSRGDREINEAKLQRYFKTPFVELAGEQQVVSATNASVGFAGPVGLSVPVYADISLKDMPVGITGANETDYHLKNVVCGRDYTINEYIDVSMTVCADGCPWCKKPLQECRGIEVGQVFQLGKKYSKALNATYHDEQGNELPFVMGCYGIGVTRTVAAAIEQSHDKDGIIWPYSIAPYHVIILLLNIDETSVRQQAEVIYTELQELGYDVLLDDRDVRPGFKFKDADLLGIPIKIVLGKSFSSEGLIEVKKRSDGMMFKIKPEELPALLDNLRREMDVTV
jgi:prolyl-tRNA synthetase